MDSNLRNGYAQSYFAGVQHQVTENLAVEVNTLGALGRRPNHHRHRQSRIHHRYRHGPSGTSGMPDIAWRSSQGSSDYNALTASIRYRSSHAQFQASYTWSHSIDNQSEPLVGDFFDLNFTRVGSSVSSQISTFARQFDSSADRGNSDFDQRQNLVFFSIVDLPAASSGPRFLRALTRDWHFSQLAAFRTGFPYTVLAASTAYPGSGEILNQRADLVSGPVNPDSPVPWRTGAPQPGKLSLPPGPGELGNTGRNAFRGPGLYNIDVSLSRSFPVRYGRWFMGEAGRLTVRVDAFNLFNHANLNNPDALLTSPDFGVATYGRVGQASGFPAVAPFHETARQLQLILRLSFLNDRARVSGSE